MASRLFHIVSLLAFTPHLVNGLEDSKPLNILFILADDFGWYDVGYHNPKIQTPNLNKLAKEGVILDSYYVQPVCTPTRGAIMTGRYPIHTGNPTICLQIMSKNRFIEGRLHQATTSRPSLEQTGLPIL